MSRDRLAALTTCGILDTAADTAVDELARLAARLCRTPIALIGLVDGTDREWLAARLRLDRPDTAAAALVCARVVAERQLLVFPDLRADLSGVDDPSIRFCAAAPLTLSSGTTVGALSVLAPDPRPGGLDERERADLATLARQVAAILDLRRGDRGGTGTRPEAQRQSALLRIGDLLRDQSEPASMVAGTSHIAGEVLGAARAGYGTVDNDTQLIDIQPGWSAPGVSPLHGRFRFNDFGDIRRELAEGEALVIDDVTTDPRTAADPGPMQALSIAALVNMPVRRHGHTVALFLVQSATPRRWTPGDLAFIRNVADRLEVALGRLSAERQQQIRNEEVAHRLKNTLAMVHAIAVQTLRRQVEPPVFAAFEQRLQTLGTAHEALLARTWDSADMRTLIAGVLATFGADGRIAVSGPDVALGARAALSVSLIVHELATNAMKYGALSVPDARVRVAWTVEDGGTLVFRWQEEGGPPAQPPARTGFGSRLLNLGLVGDGGSELHYDAGGFRAVMRAPLEEAIYRE